MTTLLILTVGTGTETRRGNLAAGLVQTLALLKPRLFWLVPSSSPDSTGIADLIRGEAPEGCTFQSWGTDPPYCQIHEPDALEACRSAVRAVIQTARKELRKGETLVVNPTSGTKQMSAGATIAALDEKVGRVDFTVGQREGGIVISGTEVIESFDAAQFFAERSLAEASALFAAGAHSAAAQLLAPHVDSAHQEVQQSQDVALCAYEWQRLRFSAARQIASRSESPVLAPLRHSLTRLAEAAAPAFIAELLASAQRCLSWNEPDEALARAYRAAELLAKARLAAAHHLSEPYSLDDFRLALPSRAAQFEALARNGTLHLGLRQAYDTLVALGDPLGRAFFSTRLDQDLNLRNTTLFGHGITAVESGAVTPILADLTSLARTHLSAPMPEAFPKRLF